MLREYNGKNALARVAMRLFYARKYECRLSPLVFMTDKRVEGDILEIVANLPRGACIIYRHFAAGDKEYIADKIRQTSFKRDLQFLIGKDEELARNCGADGVHLPERDLDKAVKIKSRYPDWIVTGAAHNGEALAKCARFGLDAGFVSPVFDTKSPGSGAGMGVEQMQALVKKSNIAVFALGGINKDNVGYLLGSGVSGIAAVSAFAGG